MTHQRGQSAITPPGLLLMWQFDDAIARSTKRGFERMAAMTQKGPQPRPLSISLAPRCHVVPREGRPIIPIRTYLAAILPRFYHRATGAVTQSALVLYHQPRDAGRFG